MIGCKEDKFIFFMAQRKTWQRSGLRFFIIILWASALSACSSSKDAALAEDCVRRNLVALDGRDRDAYLETLHSESPARRSLWEGFERLRAMEVRAETELLRWRGEREGFGYVEVLQVVRVGEDRGVERRVRGRYILKKDNGIWKVWDIQTLDIDPRKS